MVSRKRKLSDSEGQPNPKQPKLTPKPPKVPLAEMQKTESTSGSGTFPTPTIHIASWNINGFRAWAQKPEIQVFLSRPDLDILCLNETKLQDQGLPEARRKFESYQYQYWTCSTEKKGYAGVALLSKVEPISVSYGLGKRKHDTEGRVITAEFALCYLVATYVPNAGQKLVRLRPRTEEWDVDLKDYLHSLEKKGKSVIWLGDLNVVHQELDIVSFKGKKKLAGCTDEERKSFSDTLDSGFVDTFREMYPTTRKYSWFNQRNKSAKAQGDGWRLDYIVVSKALLSKVEDSLVHEDVEGSDHCPVELVLKVNSP